MAAEYSEDKSLRQKRRTGTSKYDFVKVKVWLGNMDHHYVLSRFLISRMLTVTRIPYIKAVKIALEVKKYFVDSNRLDITQAEFEAVLFQIMKSKGFDDQYRELYLMVTQFFQQRQPLVILICGTSCTGKSTLAQQLAARLNLPNVMQTDVIYELLRSSEEPPLAQRPLRLRDDLSEEGLVQEFRRECCIVRKGMDGDLTKTLTEGKPIILEGLHLDPGLYISEFGQMGIIMLPAQPESPPQPTDRPSESDAPTTASTLSPAASLLSPRNVVVVGRSKSCDGSTFPFLFFPTRSPLSRAATFAALPSQASDEESEGRDSGAAAAGEQDLGPPPRLNRRSASMPSIQEMVSEPVPGGDSGPSSSRNSPDGELSPVDSPIPSGLQSPDTASGGCNTPSGQSPGPQHPLNMFSTGWDLSDGRPPRPRTTSDLGDPSRPSRQQPPAAGGTAPPAPALALPSAVEHSAGAAARRAHFADDALAEVPDVPDAASSGIIPHANLESAAAVSSGMIAAAAAAAATSPHTNSESTPAGRPPVLHLSSVGSETPPAPGTPRLLQSDSAHSSLPSPLSPFQSLAAQQGPEEPAGTREPPPTHSGHREDPAETHRRASSAATGVDGVSVTDEPGPSVPAPARTPSQPAVLCPHPAATAAATASSSASVTAADAPQEPPVGSTDGTPPAAADPGALQGVSGTDGTPPAATDPRALQGVVSKAGISPAATGPGALEGAGAPVRVEDGSTAGAEGAVQPEGVECQGSGVAASSEAATAGSEQGTAAPAGSEGGSSEAPGKTAPAGTEGGSLEGPPKAKKLRPLFVPIVVVMDEQDHRMVAEERLCGPDGMVVDDTAGDAAADLEEQLRRLQVLQDHIASYQSQGLPVVHVQYGNFGAALDDLHEYILECIKVAMEQA